MDVDFAGICGTDLHIIDGVHPRAARGIILGHEIVGHLASDLEDLKAGTPVAVSPLLSCNQCASCLAGRTWICDRLRLIGIDVPGGAAEQVVVDARALHPLPDGIDMAVAAFFEPLAVAIHAVRRSGLEVGDRVVVVGAGPIGRAIADVANLAGAQQVVLSESSAGRAALAERDTGFTVLHTSDPSDEIRELTDGAGVDVVFDAAAHASVARGATDWVRAGGTIVVAGVYSQPVPVNLGAINFREINVVGCRVYEQRDIRTAIAFLADGRIDPRPLITKIPLDRAPQAIQALREGEHLKVLLEVASRR